MFTLKYKDYDVQFTFHHIRDIGSEIGIQAATYCTLRINDHESSAMAACSALDQFNKDKGRKIALARALASIREHIEVPFEIRDLIWHRYFNRGVSNDFYKHLGIE